MRNTNSYHRGRETLVDNISLVAGNSNNENWLLTTAIGEVYLKTWEATALPLWREYAERHSLGIAVVTHDIFRPGELELNGSCQKLLAPRELSETLGRDVRFALLDTDLLVSPQAADVFGAVPSGRIGVVSQQKNLPMDVERARRLAALYRNRFVDQGFPLWSSLNAHPRAVFRAAGLPEHDDFFCAGMIVGDSESHSNDFVRWYQDLPQGEDYQSVDWGEETWLNHCVQDSGLVHWLDYAWHALWLYEVPTYYPFLYDDERAGEAAQWCLASSLLRNNFVHLAGSWESKLLNEAVPRFPSKVLFSEVARVVSDHLSQDSRTLFGPRKRPPE